MQHRNLMIGVWNGLAKRNEDWDTNQEIEDMFKVESLADIPIDGKMFQRQLNSFIFSISIFVLSTT